MELVEKDGLDDGGYGRPRVRHLLPEMRIRVVGRYRDRAAREQGREAEGRRIDVVQRKIHEERIVAGKLEPLPDAVGVDD